MDARSIKQKTTQYQGRLFIVIAVFAITLLAGVTVSFSGKAFAAGRPCQSQYDAVAKASGTAREANAEKILDACIVKNEAHDWCDKKILPALNASSRKASMDRCKNWFKGGFMNPPNRANPAPGSPAVFQEAKNAGAALRPKYRADSRPSSTSPSSSSSGNSEARTWCQNYRKEHPSATNDTYKTTGLRGKPKWSENVCVKAYEDAKKAKKCTSTASNPNVKAPCTAGAAAASTGSAGPSGSTGSGGPSGSTTSPSGPSGTTPSGGTGSTGNAPEVDRPSLDTVEENKKDPALECTTEGANDDCDLVQKYLNPIIAFLSAFVGIAVVIGIISGGIRYASASDDPQKSAAGRQMVRNSLIALVAYIFLYAALRWLIPQ